MDRTDVPVGTTSRGADPFRRLRYPDPWKVVKYLAGCLTFSVGAYLFIHSRMGTDPLDTFALGVLRHLPLTVGIVQAAVAVACLAIVSVWTRRRPMVLPLFTFFFCGSVIDLQIAARWMDAVAVPSLVVLVAATVACAYGSALIIMSGLGIRSIDLLAITIMQRLRPPFWVAKGVIEGCLLVTGYLLGGPVGVGTVFFLIGVDLLIQPMIQLSERVFRLRNHGLPPRPSRRPEAAANAEPEADGISSAHVK
jgi:uncharacterized membrane protein YczE